MRQIAQRRAGDDVYFAEPVYLIAKEFHTYRAVIPVSREYLDRITADAEHIALKGNIIALIACINELMQQLIHIPDLPRPHGYCHVCKIVRLAQTIDAGDRRHNNDVTALKQREGRRQPQAVDFVIYRAVFLYISIRVRDIRLGLIIVVIGNKVFHSVFRKKLLELAA